MKIKKNFKMLKKSSQKAKGDFMKKIQKKWKKINLLKIQKNKLNHKMKN